MVLKEQLHQLDELIAKGELLAAIDQFYTAPTEGTDERKNHAVAFLANVETINAIHLLNSTYSEDNVTMSEFSFDYTMKDGNHKRWNEIIRRRWANGKVVDERAFRIDNNHAIVRSENIERLHTIHTYVDKAVPVEIIVERAVPIETIVERIVEFEVIVEKIIHKPVERVVE